jgi:peptidyl-prolyl cis-trans isomerase C
MSVLHDDTKRGYAYGLRGGKVGTFLDDLCDSPEISNGHHNNPRNEMRPIKFAILLASAASMLALAGCDSAKNASKDASKDASQAQKGPAAATVNGVTISQRTVDAIVKQGAAQGRPDTPETRQAIIDQLAMQIVVAEEATKKGLDKTPEIVEQLDAVKASVLANAYVRDYIKNNPVSDDAAKAEYERIKATVTGKEYKARHILVDKEADAKDIIARLKKDPAAFAKLATEKSKDTGSKPAGGDLGWFDVAGMVPEFGAAVVKLEKGKFTEEPIKTQYGYHVILLEDSRPMEAPPLEQVKPQLAQQLQQQSLKKQLDALKAGAKIEIVGAAAPTPPPAAMPAPTPAATPAPTPPPAVK